ncbi:MAG: two-component regulator propeller domain-containing protein [Acidobacteriaceae bacterium]
MLLAPATAVALQPSTPLASYGRQAWAMESGLPQNSIQALLQTRDGFLWLGTEAGLARFDGSRFEVFDRNSHPGLPGNDIRCLLQASDGALWIGTSEGLARWKHGTTTAYTTRNGLPGNVIQALAESADGVLWVWTDLGAAQLKGDRFVSPKKGSTFPRAPVVWQGGSYGSAAFALRMADGTRVEAGKTTLHLSRDTNGREQTISLATGKELPGSRIQSLFADREGALWIGTNAGLVRWAQGRLQRFPVTDVLASASILTLLEDREGDLWAGTENDGLHVLRDQRFRTLGARQGLSSDATTTVVEGSDGTIWVGTQEDGLNALRRSGSAMRAVRSWSVSDGLASNVVLSLAAAPTGDVWIGTPDGLNRIRAGRVTTFTSADGLPDDFIRSLLVDEDGSLWVGTRRGLAHWMGAGGSAAQMVTYTQANGLGSDLVGAMARDARGNLWVATLAGLSRLHGGRIDNFTTVDGLSSNVVTALLPRADGTMLIGTQDHGWDVWNGHRFSATATSGLDRTTIHAILDDGEGHLWFATDNGIARCDYSAASGISSGRGCAHWMEFGTADGLPSRETAINSHPSAWKSRDGRLWFATPKGLVEVNPGQFPINTLPPPVALERFAVDDVDEPLQAGGLLKIAAGHVHFQFEYAGLSFIAPQKVRYRYILQGFDRAWIDAGARRTAYYTNIPPGRYTFRVRAANNDGIWNVQGAVLQFELRPRFYQTLWFYALLLAAVAAAILLLVKGRVRLAEREFTAVLGERTRIAREIHDTLAQGYAGISVQLEVLAELLRMRKVDAAVEQLDQTRSYVREGLDDARQSIWALRTHDGGETTLPVRLRRVAESAGKDGLAVEFRLFGACRPLPPEMERELLRVAQEAMHNVRMHAGASHLFVQLEYGPEFIVLEIKDDGRGGAPLPDAGAAAGHFGLTGMEERAAAIGGTLEVTSEPGAGTTVRLSAPSPVEPRRKSGAQ